MTYKQLRHNVTVSHTHTLQRLILASSRHRGHPRSKTDTKGSLRYLLILHCRPARYVIHVSPSRQRSTQPPNRPRAGNPSSYHAPKQYTLPRSPKHAYKTASPHLYTQNPRLDLSQLSADRYLRMYTLHRTSFVYTVSRTPPSECAPTVLPCHALFLRDRATASKPTKSTALV